MSTFDGELAALHRLQVEYGREWRIWRSTPSPSGRSGWYASRRRRSAPDLGRDLWATLGADTAEELREELEAQVRAAEAPGTSASADSLPYELRRWSIASDGCVMSVEIDQEIRKLLDELVAAWNAGDAAAYAGLFTEDADYVTFFGLHTIGRKAIEESHRALFEGPLKGSRIGFAPSAGSGREGGARVRELGPGVALVVAHGGSALPGQEGPDPDRDSVITLTAVKGDEGWRFASFQNTRVGMP